MGFATACLSIGSDASVDPGQHIIDQWCGHLTVASILRSTWRQNTIKGKVERMVPGWVVWTDEERECVRLGVEAVEREEGGRRRE